MTRCALALLLLLGAGVSAADEPKPVPLKPIYPKAKDIPVVVPKAGPKVAPVEIKSAAELTLSPLFGPCGADVLRKEVDFAKEKLVVFAWSDEVQRWGVTGEMVTKGKRSIATFTWHMGKSKGAEPLDHFVVFVVQKDAEVLTEVNPRVPK